MKRRIKSIKGLFGQIMHYEDGVKVGESWPVMFKGSYKHYNANGEYAGYSDPGIVANLVHHDEHGSYIGETHSGLFDQKVHYDTQGYAGSSCDGLFGTHTDLFNVNDQ